MKLNELIKKMYCAKSVKIEIANVNTNEVIFKGNITLLDKTKFLKKYEVISIIFEVNDHLNILVKEIK